VRWNFEKFLIGRSGDVVARFDPNVVPLDPAIVSAVERELAA
jgi:glutathione peroxidase